MIPDRVRVPLRSGKARAPSLDGTGPSRSPRSTYAGLRRGATRAWRELVATPPATAEPDGDLEGVGAAVWSADAEVFKETWDVVVEGRPMPALVVAEEEAVAATRREMHGASLFAELDNADLPLGARLPLRISTWSSASYGLLMAVVWPRARSTATYHRDFTERGLR